MRFIRTVIPILFLIGGIIILSLSRVANAAPVAALEITTEVEKTIWDAIQKEVDSRPEAFLFHAYDWELSHVTLNLDQSSAVVWLDPLDPITGMTIATEPMVVIAELSPGGLLTDSASWHIVFQGDSGWNARAAGVIDLLPEEMAISLSETPKSPEIPLAALGGYKLPWAAGLTKSLVWSTEHTSCSGNDCYYALDFADGTMFPLLAAKGGTVFYAYDDYENNDNVCHDGETPCYHTNRLILEDKSTTPTSYQIYYHLAHDSIPASLHSKGTPVSQGQFIGLADNTGASSGHHLHFMVHTSAYGYWGPAVDITFRDVSINWDAPTQGGRPRTQAGAEIWPGEWQTDYTSGNYGTNPPTGGLTLPNDKVTVTTQTISTSGWGIDNLSVTRLQLLAHFDNAWHEVGEPQTANPFNYNLDICSAGIPAGPFDLALRVWDYEGNQTLTPLGIRHLVNAANCPEQSPVVCIPNSEQVSIYSEINFGGECKRLGIGVHNYSQFGSVGNNNAASVMVGDAVQLRMYDGDTWGDRRETLANSDRNLIDNLINIDHLSSASVQYRYMDPSMGGDDVKTPHGPSSASPTFFDSIMMTWQSHGATKYQVKVIPSYLVSSAECESATPVFQRSPIWLIMPSWSFGALSTGEYTLCVQGRISESGGQPHYSEWVMKTFPVTNISNPAYAIRTLPYTYDGEAGTDDWTASGLWRLITDSGNPSNDLWACNNTDGDYGDSTYGGGDLTSPPIQIPGQGATLRFNYRYETESDQVFWDQRWVQISRDGGRFENLVQLSDDGMNTWLTSPAIDLEDYANSTVRIRFHFSIVDKYYNGGMEGWLVDDISVTSPIVQGCEESINNTIGTASSLTIGETVSAEICPAGDVDYYRFSAMAGDKLIASVEASQLSPASLLDTHLTLLDQNKYGNSPIDSNDDLQPGIMTDSMLNIQIPEAGEYYLKVKSGDHPTSGGNNHNYSISLLELPESTDTYAPDLSMIYPTVEDGVPSRASTFSASASDFGSGVSRLDFWWHSPDWISGQWILLGSDTYGEDGWQAAFNGDGYSEGQTGALVVIAYDWEDNPRVTVQWNVAIDDTPPITNLNALPSLTDGTGIFLSWNASDARSRLGGYEIQYQMDGGSWQSWLTNIPGEQHSAWFVGQPGHAYGFRLRGRDTAGNLEVFPTNAEVTTQTTASCSFDEFDQGAGDGQAGNATPLVLGEYQTHNYCGAGDVDWIGYFAQEGQIYLIWILPNGGSPGGGSLDLYQSNESGWLLHSEAIDLGAPLSMRWIAPADGLYLIRVSSISTGVSGNNSGYSIRVGSGWWFNFPILYKR